MLLLLTLPAFARDFLQVDAGAPGMAVQANLLRESGGFTGSEVLTSDCAALTPITIGAVDRSADPSAPVSGAVLQLVFFIDAAAAPASCTIYVDGVAVDAYGDGIDNRFDIVTPTTLVDGGADDADGSINGTILVSAAARTDGGTLVLDSLSVPSGTTLAFDTTDPITTSGGNEAFLPAIVLVDGPATLDGTIDIAGYDASDAPANAASDGGDGGPGGGGGGVGSNCMGPASYLPGDGFTGGGGTNTGTCIDFTAGGVGAAEAADGADGGEGIFTEISNGALGYAGGVGGGTGMIWGTGGGGGYCCGVAGEGGFGGGGGSGHSEASGWGGGGGGFGTAGENGVGTVGGSSSGYQVGGAGKANGDTSLVPFAGGSGGAGGDSGSGTADGAGGGGGGGALWLYASELRFGSSAFVDASGGDGGDTVGTNPGSSTGGAGGAGGGVLFAAAAVSGVDNVGLDLSGGTGGREYYGYYSGDGGEGRLRVDGAAPPALGTGPTSAAATSWEGPALGTIDLFATTTSSSGATRLLIFDELGAYVTEVALAEDASVELWPYLPEGTARLVLVDDSTGLTGPAGAGSVDFDPDADGDGYDDVTFGGDDCDDTDGSVYPDAFEECDGVDDDCDGTVDEDALDAELWYSDVDGDGFGDGGSAYYACEPVGTDVGTDGDCDDGDAAVNPDATDVCNGVDDDCDGTIDNDAIDALTWYADTDGDGFGDPDATLDACEAPEGYVADASDCDDSTASTFPGATELCNDVDDDCDGEVDEDAVDAAAWYSDDDGDGFGDAADVAYACDALEGRVADASDCDDADGAVFPGAEELCNGIDDDCDGSVDDGASDAGIWYADTDGDGFGDGEAVSACDAPTGHVATDGDCDDSDAAYNPDALEEDCTDPEDYNCDGVVAYADVDGDGVAACEDCDDDNADTYAGAPEICDGWDNDCDGSVDEDAVDMTGVWTDADGDGWGGTWVESCELPTNVAEDGSDCDDTDPDIHPEAEDIPGDGIDQDCVDGDATDTGDTADTGDTGDTGDTAVVDTDSGDVPKDTGDHYEGGCGCASMSGGPALGLVALLGALLAVRRRR